MKIALCIIATGKYDRFLPDLLDSAADYFCAEHDVRFFVFSDGAGSKEQGARANDLSAQLAARYATGCDRREEQRGSEKWAVCGGQRIPPALRTARRPHPPHHPLTAAR